MKTKTVLFMGITLFLLMVGVGCEKEEKLSLNEAKGKVLGVTGPCFGNAVYIEVENPKGIGEKGIFPKDGWDYQNAISVPYFHRVNLPRELMRGGTWLHFEYRELTEEEKNKGLFEPDEPTWCTADKIPPFAKTYIITKIIAHKP